MKNIIATITNPFLQCCRNFCNERSLAEFFRSKCSAGSVNSVDISSFHFMSPTPTYFPPYLPYRRYAVSVDPVSGGKNPSQVCFIVGNISVCHGCKGRYHKELGSPNDICIQHEEWRTYTVPGSTPQSWFGNVYYHASPACIFAVWPTFVLSSLLVPPDVYASLKYEHKEWLYSQFRVLIGWCIMLFFALHFMPS